MKTIENERYLFSWDEITGIDCCRLIEFLKKDLGIEWVKEEHIQEKEIFDKLTISDEKKSISLILNDNKTKIHLIIDPCLTIELLVKEENGKLNVYYQCSSSSLISLIIAKELMIRNYLNQLEQERSWNLLSDKDAIKIKHLEIISGNLHKIHKYIAGDTGTDKERKTATLCSILEQINELDTISENCAWELSDFLDIELIRIGNESYLHTLLQFQKSKRKADWVYDHCKELIEKYNVCHFKNGCQHEARGFLEYLEQVQIEEYRYDRAKIKLREKYLNWMGVALALLLVILIVTYIVASRSDILSVNYLISQLIFVLASGATGSVLSRAVKVGKRPLHAEPDSTNNEQPLGIRSLKSETSIFIPQIVIGATAAFILFLILKAGGFQIYEKPISGIETIGVFSFLAGFSEPYFLSILGKVGGHQNDSSRKN